MAKLDCCICSQSPSTQASVLCRLLKVKLLCTRVLCSLAWISSGLPPVFRMKARTRQRSVLADDDDDDDNDH